MYIYLVLNAQIFEDFEQINYQIFVIVNSPFVVLNFGLQIQIQQPWKSLYTIFYFNIF